ncbi:MAG: type II CRISPR RNA-guided endonuclease Cas9 [Thermoguttaceae bacterium]
MAASGASSAGSYVLGLDLGVQSVGWAIIPDEGSGIKLKLGARCFESGTKSSPQVKKSDEDAIRDGEDVSRATTRREARLARRQFWRRTRRATKLFHILQRAGLLPQGESKTPEQRTAILQKLDAELQVSIRQEFGTEIDRIQNDPHVAAQVFPYILRTLALDHKLPPYSLGRALMHLVQRRGFLSNKKATGKKDEEQGVVKQGISDLAKLIDDAGARTIGEYFATTNPDEKRIRARWTARKMFKEEFEKICNAQEKFHPKIFSQTISQPRYNRKKKETTRNELSLRAAIYSAIFFQRPLKSQKGLIGMCELEKGQRRAQMASLAAQRFRYWQKILDLRILAPMVSERSLTTQEAALLANAMEYAESLTFPQVAKAIGLKPSKSSPIKFNLEAGGEKKLKGNTTVARIVEVLGRERWDAVPTERQEQLVSEMLQFQNEDTLAKRLAKVFDFDHNLAHKLAEMPLEADYGSLSSRAIGKLLPLMRDKHLQFATARKEVYGDQKPPASCDLLPPLKKVVPLLNNPVVIRTLTEMRKVVNAIIRKYGKPAAIRVELARDMKKGRKEREDRSRDMRAQETKRERARNDIIREMGIADPKPTDIVKMLLADECGWECPYTGRTITPQSLLGDQSQFDIEHILPLSRSLDNSFANKTLCYHEENRHVKKNQTPFEAYSGDKQKWEEVIARVERFQGKTAEAKKRRFLMDKIPEGFAEKMLSDTRYISKQATQYLACLYGGLIDADGTRRIQVSTGMATSVLRSEWELNKILNDGNEKSRDDHRHHAVDAVVIACCDAKTIQMLERAAAKSEATHSRRRYDASEIAQPWNGFYSDVAQAVAEINVSYRADKQVSGPLHQESNYGIPKSSQQAVAVDGAVADDDDSAGITHVIRKPLTALSAKDVGNIIDATIREMVRDKLQGGAANKVFADEKNLPFMTAHDGRKIPIKKVRVNVSKTTMTLARGKVSERHVTPGSNHHMEVVAVLDKNGNEKEWKGFPVTMFDAYQRVKHKEPVVQRDHGSGKRFKFSLTGGEFLNVRNNDGTFTLWRVRSISGQRILISRHNDARTSKDVEKESGTKPSINTLKGGKAFKVFVDHLGEIHPAND